MERKKIAKPLKESDSKKVEESPKKIGNYFTSDKPLKFFSSGCALLDCVLGGGWPLGRVSNIVGDKSSGKTLLAIEACANFILTYPDGEIRYHEAEAAFDTGYAEALGMPITKVEFIKDRTVEGLFNNLGKFALERTKLNKPGLYIIDSLDALSDEAELDRDIDEASYGTKAKKMSEIFRRQIEEIGNSSIHLMVISQIRDKMNAMAFGKKTTRSGGRALDFYASQVLYLADIGKIKKTIRKVERPIGIDVKAKCEKNKIGLPYRDCEFPILFGYGIDDVQANLDWLKQIDALDEIEINPKDVNSIAKEIREANDVEMKKLVADHTKEIWRAIEDQFMPKMRKY